MSNERAKDWHERRREFVGASEVAAILGLSPYSKPFDVWAVKKGIVEPFKGNEATRLGQTLESSILDHAEGVLGNLDRDVEVVNETRCGVVRATLDGISHDRHVVECKTAGLLSGHAADWGDEGVVTSSNQVPTHYWVQVQIQLAVADAQRGSIFALLPRRGICRFEIDRDDAVVSEMLQRVNDWWVKHVVGNQEPDIFGASLETLKRIPRNDPDKHFDNDVQALANEYRNACVEETRYRKRKQSLQAELISHLGKSEIGGLPDGSTISFKEQTRKAFSVAESTSRVFRISKAKG